jgi:hypothetical protein
MVMTASPPLAEEADPNGMSCPIPDEGARD